MSPTNKHPGIIDTMKSKAVLLASLAIVLFLAACSSNAPAINVELNNFEFGDVVNGVIATRDIQVQNDGNAPLVIDWVSASCGCTTVTIDSNLISPGETAIVHIEFDSGAHGPELTGQLIRQVFIRSNDPVNPEMIVEFSANILPPE
jgi:hypothetical protein